MIAAIRPAIRRRVLLAGVLLLASGAQASADPPAAGGMYSTYKTPMANTLFDHAFDTAPEKDMDRLMRQLLAVADRVTRYRIPKRLPNVYRVPHAELEKYVCNTNCSIKAWYKPGDGIYLDDTLKPETSVFDRSILLHEMVHYLQEISGEYENMDACHRWFHRELDAYNVQNRYLGVIGHNSRVAFTGDMCETVESRKDAAGSPSQVFGGQRRSTDPEH